MRQSWVEQPERGSRRLLRFMARITLGLGWHVGHAVLYPTTAYFFLSSAKARRASADYLGRVLGRPAGWRDVFRHYLTFASTILDRAFLITGRLEGFTFEVEGLDLVKARIAAGEGCILLGSHLGSFEALHAVADQGCPVPVRFLMYEANAARINAVANELNPGRAAGIIRIGTTESLLRVKECLAQGELVGILGDRIASGDKVARVDFLGRPATLPTGPMALASLCRAPVLLCFGLRVGRRHYRVRFEPFAEGRALPHRSRQAELAAWVQRYADAVADTCRAHPYNWFNFFDFWDEADDAAKAGPRGSAGLPALGAGTPARPLGRG